MPRKGHFLWLFINIKRGGYVNMAAVPLNLVMEKGDTFEVEFNLRDPAGNLINLLNYTIEAKMAKNYSNTATQYDLNPTILIPSEGLISLNMPASGGQLITKTQDIPEGRYVYNIRVFNSNLTRIEKVVEGIITVKGSVI